MLILDSIPPIERIKLSAALARSVTQLRSEESPLARVRLAREVAGILAELGASQPAAPELKFSLKDVAASEAAIKSYLKQMAVPDSLARFERESLRDLAVSLDDHFLAADIVGRDGKATDDQHLAAFNEIASRGVNPRVDKDRVLARAEQAKEIMKASLMSDPAFNEIADKISDLNSNFEKNAAKYKVLITSSNPDSEALRAEHKALYEGYSASYNELKKQSEKIKKDFHSNKVAKGIELFREDGEKAINAILAASPVTEEQAKTWASQQVVDKKALSKLARLGYKKDDLFRDMAEFYRITGGKASAVRISTDGGKRASAVGIETRLDEKVINLGSHFDKTVLFHELAHHLENDPIAKAASNGFLVKRRESTKAQPLYLLTGNRGYSSREVAYKDDFMNPYIGKIYDDGITEVFSMGVQYLANPKDAALLAAKDPEMFALISGYLTSSLTPAMSAKLNMHSGAIDGMQEEKRQEEDSYKDALSEISKQINITADSWWKDLQAAEAGTDAERQKSRLQYYAFPKKSTVKYLGSRGEYRLFEGTFKNQNTRRNAKGHLVVRNTSDGSVPEYIGIHGGIEVAKAFIAAAERSPSMGLSSVWYSTLYEKPGRNPKKRIIEMAEAIAGEAQ